MLREAVQRLLTCRSAGATHDEMAECFDSLRQQISARFDWVASRWACVDGSHLFTGELGDGFAILPDRRIAFGIFGQYPDALVDPRNLLTYQYGKIWVEAPRLQHARKIL